MVFIPERTSHFFSGQKSGRRASALSLLALIRLWLLCLRKGIRSKHDMSLNVCIYKGRESIGIRKAQIRFRKVRLGRETIHRAMILLWLPPFVEFEMVGFMPFGIGWSRCTRFGLDGPRLRLRQRSSFGYWIKRLLPYPIEVLLLIYPVLQWVLLILEEIRHTVGIVRIEHHSMSHPL